MGNKYRQPPPDFVRSMLTIQDRVGMLESTPRATNTAIDTGHFQFKATNGVTIVDFGDFGPGFGPGFVFRRGIGGEPAFYLGGDQTSGTQFWRLCDIASNDLFTDDVQSGQGIGRPYIPMVLTKSSDISTLPITTASTTFVNAYNLFGYKQHPRLEIQYLINVPVSVSAEVQIVDAGNSGNIVAGPNTHVGSTFSFQALVGAIDGSHVGGLNHALQFRVSAGAGTIGILAIASYGKQS